MVRYENLLLTYHIGNSVKGESVGLERLHIHLNAVWRGLSYSIDAQQWNTVTNIERREC